MSHRSCLVRAVCGLLALACAGCGASNAKLHPVAGMVTYEGKAVEGATVLFIPPGGAPSMGETDASGKYTLITRGKPGAPEGTYDVTISKKRGGTQVGGDAEVPMAQMSGGEPSEADLKSLQDQTTQMGEMMQDAVKEEGENDLLPVKYRIPQGSGLNATVTSDGSKNVFDFALVPDTMK